MDRESSCEEGSPLRGRKEGFIGPITAMFWDENAALLLSGRGSDILIQDFNQVCIGSLRPFEDGRVHVLKSRSNKVGDTSQILVAASSEKQVSLSKVELKKEASQTTLAATSTVGKLPLMIDWVLDLQLLLSSPSDRGVSTEWGHIAVGLAHNLVEIWRWATPLKLRSVQCIENPLLCSLAFFGDNEEELKVACGGFTREVLCWHLRSSPVQIEQRLRGHTGVIHCVKWRGDGKVLISASEDRCVRVWEESDDHTDNLRKLLQTHVLWGHAARIWDCRIWQNLVVSGSEDGTGRVYRLGKADAVRGEGEAETLAELRGHQGKHVWRCEVCGCGEEWKAATGGNDAAVKLWTGGEGGEGGAKATAGSQFRFQVQSHAAPTEWKEEDEEDQVMDDAANAGKERDEFVRCCRMIEDGKRVVCGTNQGRCVILNTKTGSWSCVHKDGSCQFTAIDVDEERGLIVLGDARGGLSVASLTSEFRRGRDDRLLAHDGHVMDVFCMQDAVSGSTVWYTGDNAETAEGGAVRRWAVEEGKGELVALGVIRCGTRCRVTCLMECTWGACGVVVCGDRKGTLSVMLLPRGNGGEADAMADESGTGGTLDVTPCWQVSKAHRANSVTSVVLHSDGRIYSTGRDGAVCIWKLESVVSSEQADDRRDKVKLAKEATVKGWGGLELIAGVAWDRQGRMLLTGFQHTHFVLADVAQRKLLASIDCGGARRPYGYLFTTKGQAGVRSLSQLKADPRALRLAFVRDMKLHLATCSDAPPNLGDVLASPAGSPDSSTAGSRPASPRGAGEGAAVWFHGRELHQVCIRSVGETVEALTVSEDGSMKVVRQRRGVGADRARGEGGWEVECVASLEGDRHVQLGAAMRSVATVTTLGHGEVLIAGGAKDVMHCWQRSAGSTMAVDGQDGAEWRLLSTVRVPTGRGVMARLLGVHGVDGSVLSDGSGEVVAAVAGADDGIGRVLAFHMERREWRLGCVMPFHKSAILTVSGFEFRGRSLVVTGGADGYVAVWDPTDSLQNMAGLFGDSENGGGARGAEKRLEASLAAGQNTHMAPRQAWAVHGSGVNAVEVVSSGDEGTLWMVTAGDDQQLKVTELRVSSDDAGGIQVEASSVLGVVERAHSSTIRDIALVGSSVVVSVGADQRLNLWKLPRLELIASSVTEVCDASCVDVAAVPDCAGQEVVAVVGGMGVQVIRFCY